VAPGPGPKTHCSDLADRLISELSGGQTKRCLLAFCVGCAPPPGWCSMRPQGRHSTARWPRQFYGLLFGTLRRSEGWDCPAGIHDLGEWLRRTCDGVPS